MKVTKRNLLSALFCMILLSILTDVLTSSCSIGLSIGKPTGISVNIKTNNKKEHLGYDVGLTFNTAEDNFYLAFDVIKYNYQKIVSKELTGKIPIFYGIGCVISSQKKSNKLGMEMVLGVEYIFSDIPFNIFFRLSPIILMVPSVDIDIAPAVGIRYIFK